MRRPMSILVQAVVSICLVTGAYGLWTAGDRLRPILGLSADGAIPPAGEEEPRADAAPVIVAPVEVAADDVTLRAIGTGRALRSVELRTEGSGRIVDLALAAGRRFQRGDALLRLDDREQQLAVELARARLEEATRVLDRYRTLQGRAVATEASLTEAATAREVARIELEQAEEALADRILLAPFDGVAGIPAVEPGQRIDADTPVGMFDDRSEILVEFDLPEVWLPRMSEGMAVEARTPAAPGGAATGRVSVIDSRIDPVSRTARVRVAIPNGDDTLRPGASFEIALDIEGERHPRVPELAFRFSQGKGHVWRVRDGAAERVEVTLVRRLAGSVLVEGPLEPGDEIVVEGVQRLRPGRAVEVVGGSDAIALGGSPG